MAGRTTGFNLAAVLWFLAALLAWTAVAVRYYRRDEIKWPLVAAGLACAAMGVGAWARRSRAGGSAPPGRDRDPPHNAAR